VERKEACEEKNGENGRKEGQIEFDDIEARSLYFFFFSSFPSLLSTSIEEKREAHLSSEISRDLTSLGSHPGEWSHSDSVDVLVSELDRLEKTRGGRGSGRHSWEDGLGDWKREVGRVGW